MAAWFTPALLILLAMGQDATFRARRDALAEAMRGGNDRAERERAIAQIADFSGLEPTKLLVEALEESLDTERALDRQFGALTEELSEILEGKVDVRLAGSKSKEQLAQRTELGKRLLTESEVTDLITDKLGLRQDTASFEYVAKQLSRTRDWRLETRLLEVLGMAGTPELVAATPGVLKDLHDSLRDRDARVRMFAAQALGQIGAPESVPFLAGSLEDREWQVRAFAVEALGRTQQRTAVPFLINALRAATGRMRKEISTVLAELTGMDLGVEAPAWVSWWKDHQEEFLQEDESAPRVRSGPARKDEGPFTYYGIQTYSDKVIFILDVSDSMNDDAEETELPEDGIPKRTGNLRPKIQVARDHLTQALIDLPSDTTFNIIIYNKYVRAWQPKMVKATHRNKNEALAFVLGIKASEATNIFDALELAFKFAGRFATDRSYASPVDTIFFLTDGKPTHGRLQDPPAIVSEVRRMNRIGKIKIHTIGVGYLHDRDFLTELANQSGGSYVNVQ